MLKIHVLFANVIQICYICTGILQFYPSIKTIKIMSKDIIDLTRNDYWAKEDFLEDIERIRKLFVELLANVNEDYEPRPREIGYCLTVFEILKDMEIVDGRKRQQ